jgi:cystathionine beta-lyase
VTLPNPLEQVTIEQLRRRASAKWREYPADVLPMWVAEMDVLPAEPVQRVLTDAIRTGDTGYAHGTGYAEALRDFASRRWGWDGLAVEHTSMVPDVMLGVVEMLKLVTDPGDSVVVNSPVYPPFYSFARSAARQVVEAPLGGDQRIDLDALAGAFEQARSGGRRAAYLLCNPHNPTGTVHTGDELTAVAALAADHGVRVIADEIHAPLVLPGATFVPYLSVPGGDTGLSLMSASKGWNLAGLKAAVAVAGPGSAAELAGIPEEVSHGVSHLGVMAHTAALRDGGDWLDALLSGLDGNRTLLGELLAEHLPTVGYRPPEGTFLSWLDCSALGVDEGPAAEPGLVTLSVGPAAMFLERAKVAVSAGPAFGTGGAGHIRLNYATPAELLTEGIRRMGQAALEVSSTRRSSV